MLADQQELIYITSVQTQIWKTCRERWLIGTYEERESRKSVLSAWLDDDNIHTRILIYINSRSYTQIYTHTQVLTHIYTRMNQHTCMHIRMYTRTHTSTHIHIYTHTRGLTHTLSLSHKKIQTHSHLHTRTYKNVTVVSWLNILIQTIDLWAFSAQNPVNHVFDLSLDSSTLLHIH